MRATFSFEGFQDIDEGLAALPQVTSRAVVRRALVFALQPIADVANGYWPGADDTAFAVSDKLASGQKAEVAATGAVMVHVGSTKAAPHAHLREWGTAPRVHKSGKYVGAVAPNPSLTPAWDAGKDQILERLAAALRVEFEATMARRARRGR